MLKKLLPELKQKLKSLQKKTPQQEEVQPEQKNLSPNLLVPIDNDKLLLRVQPRVVTTTSWLVYGISGIFLLLFLANFIIDYNLKTLSKVRDTLILEGDELSAIADEALSVNKAISIYKQNNNPELEFASALEPTSKVLINSVNLENFTYRSRDKGMTVFSRAPTPNRYAYLIAELLEIDQVSDITINKVELSKNRIKEYVAVLEINFK